MNETLKKTIEAMANEKNTELHCHSDAYANNGIGDGAQTVFELIQTAIEKGAMACAITDHGTCVNWIDFYNYANGDEADHKSLPAGQSVKPILGVEAYVTTDGYYAIETGDAEKDELVSDVLKGKEIIQHLVILAMDYKGMQQISRFVSETNRHVDDKGRAVGTTEMLEKFFGPDAKDTGNVIAMSACIGGVLATPLAFNHKIDHEIEKIENRIEKSKSLLPKEFFEARDKVAKANARIDELNEEVESLSDKASKKFKETKAVIKAEVDPDKKQYLEEKLEIEMEETKQAKERIAECKKTIQDIRKSISEDKKLLTKCKPKAQTIETNLARIEALQSIKKSETELLAETTVVMKYYDSIFGHGNFYAEMQYHGDELEADLYPIIAQLARANGIKLVATNDNHMANPEDLQKRMLLKNCTRIKTGVWSGPLDSDSELYFKTALEKAEMLSQILPDDMVIEAFESVVEITNRCNARLPETKVDLNRGITEEMVKPNLHYPEFKDADEKLRELAINGKVDVSTIDGKINIHIECPNAGIEARYGDEWNPERQEKLDYELSVIKQMGVSSYFLFIADVIGKCKGARDNALDIGPGRGSGAGSDVCYLTGITNLEPNSLGLLFERFLNPERVSMPDIDTDFSAFAREYAINYVTETYGARAIAGIMTKAVMGPLNALTYAPKLYAMERGEDTRTYASTGTALRSYARGPEVKDLSSIEDIINDKFGKDPVAMKIFEYAKLIEGYITSYGQHAAGVIALQGQDVEDYIPLLKTSDDGKLAIQADMIQAEGQLGFLKFDFLGLKNLNVYTHFMQMITARRGIRLDPNKMKFDDPKVYSEIFAKGNTNFIFQFESDGMKKMLMRLKPTCFIDLVLAVSVYRPGPMDFIDDIIHCKNTGEKSPFLQKFPQLEDVLRETYGFPVFQEQVMKIAQICAGYSLGAADNLRRVMSKKDEVKLEKMRPGFIEGCMKNGISEEDANWLFEQLRPFAKYGFNKSHAAAYSYVAYITAHAKCYYPAEYLCSAMTEQGSKTLQFISDCKKFGIEVKRVDINKSDVDFTVESENVIRIGFSAIKGLKNEAFKIVEARKDGLYTSIKDFVSRTNLKKNSVNAVILSGACDDFSNNREATASFVEELSLIMEDIDKCATRLTEIAEQPDETDAELKAKNRLLTQWENKLAAAQASYDNCYEAPRAPLSVESKLAYESQFLGMWVSGSPLEDYDLSGYKSIEEFDAGRCKIAGVITGLNVFTTRAGAKMATFTLLDKESVSIRTVVFPNQFEMLADSIRNNAVVEIRGSINYKESGEDEDDEKQLIVDGIKMLSAKVDFLTITAPKVQLFAEIEDLLHNHRAENGMAVHIIDWFGNVRNVMFSVSENIVSELNAKNIEYVVGVE